MLWDIVVIGGGIAGITAAVYAARAGKRVLLLEKETVGGQIADSPKVENYPGYESVSGSALSEVFRKQALDLGIEIKREKALSAENERDMKCVRTAKNAYTCRAIILAGGVKHRHLGIDAEAQYVGRGVSYCALCDGAFFKNKTVAVVGGGNTAAQNALFLAETAKEVYLIHRRSEFRAYQAFVTQLTALPNVKLCLNKTVTALSGAPLLRELTLTDTISGETQALAADGLFVSVGQVPDNGAFSDLADLDENGFIVADETCLTKTAGVFAAGDCRTKSVRQLTTAAADGSVAAVAACEYIAGLLQSR